MSSRMEHLTVSFFAVLEERGQMNLLEWCMHENLISSRYECPKCGKNMVMRERKGTIDGYEWRCRMKGGENPHDVCKSIRKGTWFSKSHLSVCDILILTHHFFGKSMNEFAVKDARVNKNTVVDWYMFCREVCMAAVLKESEPLGGEGKIVEIDESMFGKMFNFSLDCPVRWLTYGMPKTGQAKKNWVKSGHRPFSPLTQLQHVEFTPALTFFPTYSDFWLDFPPVVRMACEIKLLESEATTGFFVLLGEQGNKAVLDWVIKEGLIPSRYECPKSKKGMRLVERKGTIDGFEWRCRVQSKENPYFVCRSNSCEYRFFRMSSRMEHLTISFFAVLEERGQMNLLEWCMRENLISSRYECPKWGKNMVMRERKGTIDGYE
ncbi:mitotic-spindle organizing protein 2A [Trichonephila clavipes]|nr:mitotic-spindle organizing protein 2A [Trichonephila clavipes]